jgi:hypothetical protein
MSDIIERLEGNSSQYAPLMREAAAEITRLSKVNEDLDAAYLKEATEHARLRTELKAQQEAAAIFAARQK